VLVLGANFAAFGILWVVKLLVFNRLFKITAGHGPSVGADEIEDAELVEAGPAT
jgi:hypothetical protein